MPSQAETRTCALTIPLTDEQIASAAVAYREQGSIRKTAALLGLSYGAAHKRVTRAAERGLLGTKPVLPGYEIKSIASKQGEAWVRQGKAAGEVFEMPDGHTAKGYSALVDAEGRVIQKWVKTRETPSAADIADILAKRFQHYEPAAPSIKLSSLGDADLHCLVPCNDWHVGMFAWVRETETNWDLKIGPRVIGAAIDETIGRSPISHTAIVLGGGDLTHADNNDNRTKRSGNVLDVDGRHTSAPWTRRCTGMAACWCATSRAITMTKPHRQSRGS